MTIRMGKEISLKLLVVDGTPESLDITVRALKETHFQIFSASNGVECLQATHNVRPDLLLIDVMLPDINGKDLIKNIKSNTEFSSNYIILLSSLETSPGNNSSGLEEGADEYIIRPVNNRELVARVVAAGRIITSERALKACIDSPNDMIILAIDTQYNYLAFNTYHKNVMLKAYGTTVKEGMNLLECMKGEEDIKKAKANYCRGIGWRKPYNN